MKKRRFFIIQILAYKFRSLYHISMDNSRPIQVLAHCPLCQAVYADSHVRLLGEKGTSRLFHCSCSKCGHALMAVIVESSGAISSVGLVTDLEIQDAVRFRDAQSITADECVAMHRGLRDGSRALCERLVDKKA